MTQFQNNYHEIIIMCPDYGLVICTSLIARVQFQN